MKISRDIVRKHDKLDIMLYNIAIKDYVYSILSEYTYVEERYLTHKATEHLLADFYLPEGIAIAPFKKVPTLIRISTKLDEKHLIKCIITQKNINYYKEFKHIILLVPNLTNAEEFLKTSKRQIIELKKVKSTIYYYRLDHFLDLLNIKVEIKKLIENPFLYAIKHIRIDALSTNFLNDLKNEIKQKSRKNILFLGAGVSAESGIPMWNELLTKIEKKCLSSGKLCYYHKMNFDNISYMRILKLLSNKSFASAIEDSLYQCYDSNKQNKTLDAITNFINRNNVKNIITYNFDDLLETKLGSFNCKSITIEKKRTSKNKINIYHLHGKIDNPQKNKRHGIGEIILAEDEYNNLLFNNKHWTNRTQEKFLKNELCIFVGCSFVDINLKKLLDQVKTNNKEKHCIYAFMCSPNCLTEHFLKHIYFRSLGIQPIWYKSFDEIAKSITTLGEI